MDESGPVRYEGTGKLPEKGLLSTVEEWDIHCTYPNGVKMHFLCDRLAKEVIKYRKRWSDHGTTFHGSEGWLSVDRGGIESSDPKLVDLPLKGGDEHLYVSPAHDRNFLDCVKSRELPAAHAEIGHRSASVCHLGNVAIRLGRNVKWDPVAERFPGDDEANEMLLRPMRAPWVL
jgi:hypothetical protein